MLLAVFEEDEVEVKVQAKKEPRPQALSAHRGWINVDRWTQPRNKLAQKRSGATFSGKKRCCFAAEHHTRDIRTASGNCEVAALQLVLFFLGAFDY